MVYQNNYFILTGAMGAGKSTLLKELRGMGMTCVDEPARKILAEQRTIDGQGVPDRDPLLFSQLLLSRAIAQYNQWGEHKEVVIFDRGVPDNIGYAQWFELETHAAQKAAEYFRYNPIVFFLPAWEAIYENDEERKMTFEQAKEFGESMKAIYKALDYTIVTVPKGTPKERTHFILEKIKAVFPK